MTYKLCYIQVHVPIDNVRIIQLNGRGGPRTRFSRPNIFKNFKQTKTRNMQQNESCLSLNFVLSQILSCYLN